jgi:hypothetical protein
MFLENLNVILATINSLLIVIPILAFYTYFILNNNRIKITFKNFLHYCNNEYVKFFNLLNKLNDFLCPDIMNIFQDKLINTTESSVSKEINLQELILNNKKIDYLNHGEVSDSDSETETDTEIKNVSPSVDIDCTKIENTNNLSAINDSHVNKNLDEIKEKKDNKKSKKKIKSNLKNHEELEQLTSKLNNLTQFSNDLISNLNGSLNLMKNQNKHIVKTNKKSN